MPNPPTITILGPDPIHRTHRINANSFQQHALTTINAYQYAAFYTTTISPKTPGALSINLARRPISKNKAAAKWESFAFEDYEQVMDDGHNTISIGVCEGDGTVHIAFDHHCDRLRFRISKKGVALSPESHIWNSSLFSEIRDSLPGVTTRLDLFEEVTYPRFVNVGDDMLLSFRIGKAGAGSEVLYHYSSHTQTYKYTGTHLTGLSNNPYTNGLSYSNSPSPKPNLLHPNCLHISWTYRAFLDYPDQGIAHKVQAGPNGPENNYNLYYAYSEDLGVTWKGVKGDVVAVLDGEEDGEGTGKGGRVGIGNTILPNTEGILVREIPKGSGILNQESQCVDKLGRMFILNRENVNGQQKWMIYWKEANSGTFHTTPIHLTSPSPTPTETGPRGSICVDNLSRLWIVLQDNVSDKLFVLKAKVGDGELAFEVWWWGEGYDGEPLVDEGMMGEGGVLSVFTRTVGREIVVLDFDVGG